METHKYALLTTTPNTTPTPTLTQPHPHHLLIFYLLKFWPFGIQSFQRNYKSGPRHWRRLSNRKLYILKISRLSYRYTQPPLSLSLPHTLTLSHTTQQVFYLPLRSTDILSSQELQSIFSNIEEILSVSETFARDVQARFEEWYSIVGVVLCCVAWKWAAAWDSLRFFALRPAVQSFGDIFLQYMVCVSSPLPSLCF